MRPKNTIPRRFFGTTCCSCCFQDAPGSTFGGGSLGAAADEAIVGMEDERGRSGGWGKDTSVLASRLQVDE